MGVISQVSDFVDGDQAGPQIGPQAALEGAQLSPRTFSTFPRELSSRSRSGRSPVDAPHLRRGVERCIRTADDRSHDTQDPPAATL